MKKVLFLTVALVVTSFASAQQLVTKEGAQDLKIVTPNSVYPKTEVKVNNDFFKHEAPVPGVVAASPKAMKKHLAMPAEGVKPAAALSTVSKAPKKAGSVQEYYYGYGTDYYYGTAVEWITYDAYDTDGTTYFGDIVPTIFEDDEMFYVPYTQSGSTITIEPYLVGYTTSYYIYLCSGSSSDGSIYLDIADDGGLSTATDGEIVLFAAFTYGYDFDPNFSTGYAGYFAAYEDITYLMEGEIPEATACFAPETPYIFAGPSYDGYVWGGAYATIPAGYHTYFTNFSTNQTSNAWSVSELIYDSTTGTISEGETYKGSDDDFFFKPIGGSMYGPVSLTTSNSETSASYTFGVGVYNYEDLYAYSGGSQSDWTMSSGSTSLMGLANYDNAMAYYSFLGTTNANSYGYDISDLIIYQGVPSQPIFCTGIDFLVYDFVANSSPIQLTCQIYKVTRSSGGSQYLGDLIAESSTVSVLDAGTGVAQLQFTDFYSYDDDGLTVGQSYLFIEDEFAVVFHDWNNGTFDCSPEGEYYQPDAGLSTVSFVMDDTQYYFPSLYSHLCVGFTDFAYGWLVNEEGVNYESVEISAEGGTQSITISTYLCGVDDDGDYTSYIAVDESCEVPDWITLQISSETYSTSAKASKAPENFTESWAFTLDITCEPLVDGEEGRVGEIVLYQPGAYFTIKVIQGEVTGIETVKTETVKTTNGKSYNIAGQRVANDAKGLVIRDGKKFINK